MQNIRIFENFLIFGKLTWKFEVFGVRPLFLTKTAIFANACGPSQRYARDNISCIDSSYQKSFDLIDAILSPLYKARLLLHSHTLSSLCYHYFFHNHEIKERYARDKFGTWKKVPKIQIPAKSCLSNLHQNDWYML